MLITKSLLGFEKRKIIREGEKKKMRCVRSKLIKKAFSLVESEFGGKMAVAVLQIIFVNT